MKRPHIISFTKHLGCRSMLSMNFNELNGLDGYQLKNINHSNEQ